MAVNKVVFGNTTVMDITDSTVTANKLKSGEYAYGANGQKIVGTLVVPEVLNDLSDVVITTPQTAQEIYFDGTNWINYGAKIILTFDDDFKGHTIILTKGQTTITKTAPLDSNTMNLYINETGLWTISSEISGDTYETEVNVTTFGTSFDAVLSSVPPMPEGATVLPTDDIQTWLKCANITDKAYTTLAEVLADRETFETLIADSNACDYMARSMTWAVAEGAVPTLTTTSSNVISSGDYSGQPAWKVFDGDNSTPWSADAAYLSGGAYVGYKFDTAKNINSLGYIKRYESASATQVWKVQGSSDGTDWIDLSDNFTVLTAGDNDKSWHYINFTNTNLYSYYRVYEISNNNNSLHPSFMELQFYEADITRNQDAMALIGKYDYCSNVLLSNATWAEAIANSDYFEYVLNVKIPILTSSSTGVIYSNQQSSYEAYKAFDNNTGTWWAGTPHPGYIGYDFATPVKIYKVSIMSASSSTSIAEANIITSFKMQGSADGNTWTDKTDTIAITDTTRAVTTNYVISDDIAYRYNRLLVASNKGGTHDVITELQFYGRASSEVLVPLVPTMTSDTTPSGEVTYSSQNNTYVGYKMWDFSDSTSWVPSSLTEISAWNQYEFNSPVKISKLDLYICRFTNSQSASGVKIQAYVNNEWVDLKTITSISNTSPELYTETLSSPVITSKIRLITTGTSNIAVRYMQAYAKTVQTNIVHSCANDTIYYMEDGSPVIVATTNSNGDGILDFSTLEDKEYAFYSSVAKDPSNLSNDFSKTIRITKSEFGGTTEMYLMPDTVKTLYWYGYMSNNFEETSPSNGWTNVTTYYSPTFNTNYLTMNASANNMAFGVGNKTAITGMSKAYAIGSGSGANAQFACQSQKSFTISITNHATFSSLNKYELTNNSDDGYMTANAQYRGNSITLYAMWYE